MPYVMYVALQGDDKLLRFTMDADDGETHATGRSGGAGRPGAARCRSAATVFVCGAPWRLYYVEFSYSARHGEPDSRSGK